MSRLLCKVLLFGLLQCSSVVVVLSVDDGSVRNNETTCDLKQIVGKIIEVNKVQSKYVEYERTISANFNNFVLLKKCAKLEELLQLTDNTNATVACYAAMALADTSYKNLKDVFQKFIKLDRLYTRQSGHRESQEFISFELYHRYWNRVLNLQNDSLLFQLDSVILYTNSPHPFLTLRALENRVYSEPHKSRICHMAFDNGNVNALFYLCTWHRAEFLVPLKKALVKYLNDTEFQNVGYDTYYKVIEELFKFRERELIPVIVNKLKADKSWDEKYFRNLLGENGISIHELNKK